MDIASILGFILGAVFLIGSIFVSAEFDMQTIGTFVDVAGIAIVFGGTIATTIIAFSMATLGSGMKAFGKAFNPPKANPIESIRQIIRLANMARKEGILALEEAVQGMDDEFLKKGIMLVVDGTDPELVRNILETEMSYIEGRHGEARKVWEFMTTAAPSWGMMGTLIGLIVMLNNMADPDLLGPAMAVAIITTLYGSIIANYIAGPVVNKLKIYSGEEIHVKEVLVEGILSIQNGENPRIIEEKLKAFLSPILREAMNYEEPGRGGAGGE